MVHFQAFPASYSCGEITYFVKDKSNYLKRNLLSQMLIDHQRDAVAISSTLSKIQALSRP